MSNIEEIVKQSKARPSDNKKKQGYDDVNFDEEDEESDQDEQTTGTTTTTAPAPITKKAGSDLEKKKGVSELEKRKDSTTESKKGSLKESRKDAKEQKTAGGDSPESKPKSRVKKTKVEPVRRIATTPKADCEAAQRGSKPVFQEALSTDRNKAPRSKPSAFRKPIPHQEPHSERTKDSKIIPFLRLGKTKKQKELTMEEKKTTRESKKKDKSKIKAKEKRVSLDCPTAVAEDKQFAVRIRKTSTAGATPSTTNTTNATNTTNTTNTTNNTTTTSLCEFKAAPNRSINNPFQK